MSRYAWRTLALFGGLILACQPVPAPPKSVGVALGSLAPEIRAFDLDGEPISLSDYRGKVVLLDFWQSG